MNEPDLFAAIEPEAPRTCGNCAYRKMSLSRERGWYCSLSFRDVMECQPACNNFEAAK